MVRKITLLLFLFSLVFTIRIQAQNAVSKTIDSLKIELNKTTEDSTKASLLNKLSGYSGYINSDEAISYAKQALKYAKKTNDIRRIGDSYGSLGVAYEVKSDYVNSLDYLYKALTIYEDLEYRRGLTIVYNNLGLIYIDLKNYKQGLKYYNKALQLSLKSNKDRNASLLLNNIGDVYLQEKDYKKALVNFYKALIINKKLNDKEAIGLNLTNIGICYINLKNYPKGIEIINKSIDTYEDYLSLYNTYNIYELGRVNYLLSLNELNKNTKKQLLDNSIAFFDKALANFQKYESLKDIQETYYYLSKTNKAIGNFEIALDYYEKYTEIKNSVFSEDSEKKLTYLESKREIDLRDKQIEIQKLKIKNDSRKVYLLITITIAVAILLGLFFLLYISKRKTNKIISEINNQKDKFFSIIAHDLRGPFNGFLGLTELMAEDIDIMTTEEVKFAAVNMRSSAKNLFTLLENLLNWSRMEQHLIPFDPKEYLLKPIIVDSILTLQDTANNKAITIDTTISQDIKVFADINMLQAVIRNIALNAIKFTPKNGFILIKATEDNKKTIISVTDSGIGMNEKIIENLFKLDVQNNRIGTDEEPSTGLGLILCKEFIEKHSGKIWVESEEGKGSTFYFSLPK
ncbi:tetratricopeptide repeat-containing sensor histidine kinase [Flavobacterium sp. N3904]|uniref:tetratricopeptide repeat-containing sensor histidine kinase n=1 Tax=Flavobacterium sp. N3904 TaxID=2986835 RepID=UPI002225051C|nr:tetratricopeptide repeat-containing sensor histidine kinase [Flavobacterium sp. N3904]